ncbi:MAG: hypothetical protein IV094_23455, partial [Vitreoscilla sp.]|nr:hypothetical protein [Vitreoscilla sp.]
MTAPRVRRAGAADLPALAALFDAYRQFYDQPADAALARRFLGERIARDESVLFLGALCGAPGAGVPAPPAGRVTRPLGSGPALAACGAPGAGVPAPPAGRVTR